MWKSIVCLCFLFLSCTDQKVQVIGIDETLFFDAAQVDTLLCSTIENIEFLALEPVDKADIYGVSKMVIKEDWIYMGDFHTGKIVAYDRQGKVKFVLDKKGAGPEEYLELKSFAVDEQNIYTLDNFRHVLNVYDCRTGAFKRSHKLPFVVWDMEVLDEDHFIFAFIPMEGAQPNKEQPPYKIFITDKNLAVTKKYLKYEPEEYEFIGRPCYFSSTKDGVIFNSMDSDTFTIFFTEDSVKQVAIDFADKIPDKYRKDRHKILEGGYNFISQVPIACNNYLAFDFSVGDNIMSYIYDGNAGYFRGNADISSYNYLFPPIAGYKNQLVSYLDNYSLYEEVAGTGFTKASPVIENHLKNEGAILIFYTMR